MKLTKYLATMATGFAAATMLMVSPANAVINLNDDGTMQMSGKIRFNGKFLTSSSNKQASLGFQGGDLLQQRNSIIAEFRWTPPEVIQDMRLDIYAQGRAFYDGAWDYGARGLSDREYRNSHGYSNGNYIDRYKQQVDFFAGFVDMSYKGLFLRVGKQALSWGEMSTLRILDNICPLDTQGPGVDMEERLIPLWMARANYSMIDVMGLSNITMEGYYIPGAIEKTNSERQPGGNWNTQVPLAPSALAGIQSMAKLGIYNLDTHMMHNGGDRYGVKLGATYGDLQVNLAYMHTYATGFTPFQREQTIIGSIPLGGGKFYNLTSAKQGVVGINVFGGSFTTMGPDDWVIRGEAAYFDKEPVGTGALMGNSSWLAQNKTRGGYDADYATKNIVRYGLGFDKQANWQWLNPNATTRFTFEYVGSYVLKKPDGMKDGWIDPVKNNGDSLVESRINHQLVMIVVPNYSIGSYNLNPQMTATYDIGNRAAMFIPALVWTDNQNWEMRLQYTHVVATTYKGVGFLRDKNALDVTFSVNF